VIKRLRTLVARKQPKSEAVDLNDAAREVLALSSNELQDSHVVLRTKSHGMGIGLSISRSIIESHEVRLWASANDGHCTTFSFSIPCRSERAPGLGDTHPGA